MPDEEQREPWDLQPGEESEWDRVNAQLDRLCENYGVRLELWNDRGNLTIKSPDGEQWVFGAHPDDVMGEFVDAFWFLDGIEAGAKLIKAAEQKRCADIARTAEEWSKVEHGAYGGPQDCEYGCGDVIADKIEEAPSV